MRNAVDRMFVLEGDGNVMTFPGDYEEYLAYITKRQAEQQAREAAAATAARQEIAAAKSSQDAQSSRNDAQAPEVKTLTLLRFQLRTSTENFN
jgi:ATPase subunit of ABC transporter with duplicated ATPase domains